MKSERQEKILEILERKEFATVTALSEELFVSLPTIRRDLSELEGRGLITRSHGGAASISGKRLATPFDFRIGSERETKIRMSRAAADTVADSDCIFIDSSTSCMHIADHLQGKKNLTVVTNSAFFPQKLLGCGFKLYCTGGKLIESSFCHVGRRAVEFIKDFHFDTVFFSSYAIDAGGTVTDYSQQETELRREVLLIASRKVMLCDSSKFNRSAAFFVTDIKDIDLLITDRAPEFDCKYVTV